MAPKDDAENWRTIMRFRNWAKSQPVLIALLAYALGGGSGTLIEKFVPEKTDPKLDSVWVVVRRMEPQAASIGPLGDTVRQLDERVSTIEDRDARLAYMAPRNNEPGRRSERR